MPLLRKLTIKLRTKFTPSSSASTSPTSSFEVTSPRSLRSPHISPTPTHLPRQRHHAQSTSFSRVPTPRPQPTESIEHGDWLEMKAHRRMDSFLSDDGVSMPTHVAFEAVKIGGEWRTGKDGEQEKEKEKRMERRKSRFREELGDDVC
ncbi:hypothetical protein K504DRAFT_55384 [Pleomassaria siparia CBS 279.74]|uniref:Uncharacterized protein n=1 Tax=Pleomassaria siparia CBS 279.74 TaxID=1314801 RepID=A0A6G1K3C6_9PLEO|nr:hypothetical protein K504DRAFT_55384 [Pleomassaria siparia CBS 279.74]